MSELVAVTLIEQEIDRVNTKYRESPKLLHMLRTYLSKVTEPLLAVQAIPSFFDILSAQGEQLTFIGERLGWGRCHCICNTQPVFGFDCTGVPTGQIISGFCDESVSWEDCGPFGTSDLCITSDDVYRKFLLVRRYQMLSLYDLESLTTSLKIFFGDTAFILEAGNRRVVIAFGRELTTTEQALLQLYPRVLPVAPGITIRFHFGPVEVFGFGEGWGGFCEEFEPNGTPLAITGDDVLVTEDGEEIWTGPLTQDAPWMCEITANPYGCAD